MTLTYDRGRSKVSRNYPARPKVRPILELVVDAVTWGSPIPAADVEPTGFIGTSSGSAGLDDAHDCTADELVQEMDE